ncbi:LamG domain-containing protein [Candidatus Poribacteria bacterium]|nr:LamG domain-containing protein [Candidatus Poribacteria bacterium]
MKKIVMLLTIMIVGLIITVTASTKTIVTDGLVSYWTFDQGTIRGGKVLDVWNENDATLVGDPKRVDDGYVKSGIELDGNGDYVSLPNVGNFGSQIGAYTFEVWFKTTQKKEWSAIYRVLEKSCAGSNQGTGILINAKTPQDGRGGIITKEGWILFERSMNRENDCHTDLISKEFTVSDGEWHQIVFATQSVTEEDKDRVRHFKGNLEDCINLQLYIDVEQRSDSILCISPQNFVAYGHPIFLGAMNSMGEASRFFEGVFDEVRIYDRALTHEEVVRNYESGIGLGVEAVEKLPTVWGALKRSR